MKTTSKQRLGRNENPERVLIIDEASYAMSHHGEQDPTSQLVWGKALHVLQALHGKAA